MDYSTLKSKIATHLDRTDLTAKIPTFVDLAIKSLESHCFHFQMTAATMTAASGAGYIALPSDFIREVKDGFLDSDKLPMTKESYADIFEKQQYSSDTDKPTSYAITDKIYLYPIPDSAYTLPLSYYRHIGAPASDTGTAGTNAWTVEAWDVTFWETLEQAWRQVGDLEEQGKAKAEKDKVLLQLKSKSGRLTGRGQVRYIEF